MKIRFTAFLAGFLFGFLSYTVSISTTPGPGPEPLPIADREKLEMILRVIDLQGENVIKTCASSGIVQLSPYELSESVQRELPRENFCEITFGTTLSESKPEYHEFSGWKRTNDGIFVFAHTNYWGGNSSGCEYFLTRKGSHLRITVGRCGAAAG